MVSCCVQADGKEWEYYNEDEEKEKKESSMYELFLGEAKAGDIGAMHSVGKILCESGADPKKVCSDMLVVVQLEAIMLE